MRRNVIAILLFMIATAWPVWSQPMPERFYGNSPEVRTPLAQADSANDAAAEKYRRDFPWLFTQPRTQTVKIEIDKKVEKECDYPEHGGYSEVLGFAWCWIKSNAEALVASGTLLVALVTGLLAISTHTAASAARVAAEALPTLERAYIFIEFEVIEIKRKVRSISRGEKVSSPWVSFFFINHGKTPAIIKEISFYFSEEEKEVKPGKWLTIEEPAPPDIVLAAGDSTEVTTARLMIDLTEERAKKILAGDSCIYFWGQVAYDDIFRKRHFTRFLFRYSGTNNVWGCPEGDKYNERT